MTSISYKVLEFERLRKLTNEENAYFVLNDLQKIAEINGLQEELEQIEKIRENFRFLDVHLKAGSIDPMFANTKRSSLVFEILDLISHMENKKNLKIKVKNRKEVNLFLDPTLGLDEKKKMELVKMLEKILKVRAENINIARLSAS